MRIARPSRPRRRAIDAASHCRPENVSNTGTGAVWNPVTQTPSPLLARTRSGLEGHDGDHVSAACAAASRAMGTRYGEQET
jgi:hypothetical protein